MSMLKTNMLVRSLSTTSAASSKMVKPPVQVFGMDGRYAAALYSAASKTKVLDAVEKELSAFQQLFKTDLKMREMLVNPTLKRSLKSSALMHAAKATNLSATTGNFLGLLAENGRLNRLDAVINAFKIMMGAHRGEITCEVVTAKPLDQAQRQSFEAALKKFLAANETLQLSAKVDPSLIGGMIVSIGDKYVDMSVASKVKKYTELISVPA